MDVDFVVAVRLAGIVAAVQATVFAIIVVVGQ